MTKILRFAIAALGALALAAAPPSSTSGIVSYEPVASTVVFHARSTGHDFDGTTTRVAGRFACDRARPAETARAEIRIGVRGLETGIGARDTEMYTRFEADRNPEIIFRLKRLEEIAWTDADSFRARAVGDLTIRGVTRERPVDLAVTFRGDEAVVTGGAPVKMTDFGIDPPGFLFFRVSPDVRIEFAVRGRARGG